MNNRGREFSNDGRSVTRGGRSRRRKRGNRNKEAYRSPSDTYDSDEIFIDKLIVYPVHSTVVQNFDFAGFLVLVEETYDCLTMENYSFIKEMPFSVFQHVMVNYLNLQILKIAWSNGHQDFPDPRGSLFGACLPKPIADYISHVSNTVSPKGMTVALNLPKIAVAQGPIGDIPSGTFGVVDERTHNVYECYISPLVTANRVIASGKKTPDYQPLPSAIFPPGLVPTENLLGYGKIDNCSSEWQRLLSDLEFPNDASIEGRLKISSTLCHRVSSTMSRMILRMKMTNYCKEIIPKSVYSNLCFVESFGNMKTSRISRKHVSVYSHDGFSSLTANQANLECMHRHRIAEGEQAAVGSCYTAPDGSTPLGWSATCNSNFDMDGEFAPKSKEFEDCPELRYKRFVSYATSNIPKHVYKNFITNNYLI